MNINKLLQSWESDELLYRTTDYGFNADLRISKNTGPMYKYGSLDNWFGIVIVHNAPRSDEYLKYVVIGCTKLGFYSESSAKLACLQVLQFLEMDSRKVWVSTFASTLNEIALTKSTSLNENQRIISQALENLGININTA